MSIKLPGNKTQSLQIYLFKWNTALNKHLKNTSIQPTEPENLSQIFSFLTKLFKVLINFIQTILSIEISSKNKYNFVVMT
jgi:hypothetical protein